MLENLQVKSTALIFGLCWVVYRVLRAWFETDSVRRLALYFVGFVPAAGLAILAPLHPHRWVLDPWLILAYCLQVPYGVT